MNPDHIYTYMALGRTQEIQNDNYKSFEIDMLTMYHIYDLSTKMEGTKTTSMPKSIYRNTNEASHVILLQDNNNNNNNK